MSSTAKYFSLAYNSGAVTKGVALKSSYLSVRLIKDTGELSGIVSSHYTNILLNGKCIDPETRKLYVFYLDVLYGSAWIIEIDIDNRTQTVVYYDKYNAIGFNRNYKFYNAQVVHGKLIWTDNLNPIYQMDIARAKNSFLYEIGYGQYPVTLEWNDTDIFYQGQKVSYGKYFYNAKVHNQGVTPGTDDSTWEELCYLEDAYYSMNVENFYFAPLPPQYPPVIEYYSDDDRKINNLKRTLFQFAYRYIYIDWRKSTFSPASVVNLPQAEEDVLTGVANKMVSLNNTIKITVNLGGEEVRAVEVVARSNDNPSVWYLVETIEKFTEQERIAEEPAPEPDPEPTDIFGDHTYVLDEDDTTYLNDDAENYLISD